MSDKTAQKPLKDYWWTDSRNTNYYILNDDGIVGGPFSLEHQVELRRIVDLHNKAIRKP